MIGETPTTGAGPVISASRMSPRPRIVPIDTTGFDGATSTTSAVVIASSTAGVALASPSPTCTNASAGREAR